MGDASKKVKINRASMKPVTPGVVGIKTSHHEGALVCSAEFETDHGFGGVQEKLNGLLTELAGWVNDNGGVVGHIKAFISGGQSAALSTTGADVNTKIFDSSGTALNLAAIVYVENEKGFISKLAAGIHNLKKSSFPAE